MAESLPRWFEAAVARTGPTADDPRTAARVVAVVAAMFSVPWFALVGGFWLLEGGGLVIVALTAVLLPATLGNASAVTYLVWGRLVGSRRWSYRRGVLVGVAIGAVSYATIGVVWMTTLQGLVVVAQVLPVTLFHNDPTATYLGVVPLLGGGVFLSVASVIYTLGIPMGLSVAAGVWLTYARRRTLDGGRASRR